MYLKFPIPSGVVTNRVNIRKIKAHYRRRKYQLMVEGEKFENHVLVRQAIAMLDQEAVRATCEKLISVWQQMPEYRKHEESYKTELAKIKKFSAT